MGTTYSVKIAHPPRGMTSAAARQIVDDVLALIDIQMSTYRPDSEISSFNRSDLTDWFAVSPELQQVIAGSLQVSAQSEGALDITIAPLVNLWGMGPDGEPKDLPAQSQIDAARERVGYKNLSTRENPPAIRKSIPELSLDLNAVAPGYAVDLLASRLRSHGAANFMIDIGGEVKAEGVNSERKPWRIAIEKPINAEPEPYAIAALANMAITTSGEYRHYYVRDGHRYSHTIDPRTARPVEHSLASVVVIAPSAFEADAWATALNVLGEVEGLALAERRQISALFIVDRSGELEPLMTTPFPAYLAVPPSR
jgi:thiamine biosynthesis lipoprotein